MINILIEEREDQPMKHTYTIYYIGIEGGEELDMVGGGYGCNEEEAIEDFKFWHDNCKEIISVEFYK